MINAAEKLPGGIVPLIRPATRFDIPAMLAIESRSVTAAHWSSAQYEELFSNSNPSLRRLALAITAETIILGFLVARGLGEEWEIENLAVEGTARRRGLGTRLLLEFLDLVRAEGAREIFLEVRESNRAARSLYGKWSFVESGKRVGYYREPDEDAVVCRLAFP